MQHLPAYTLGKRGKYSDFKSDIDRLKASGAEISSVPRGGETTYHGPGQVVAYPIVDLRKLKIGARKYVESLEDSMIDTADLYGIRARGRIPGRTGVWVDDRKIGAVGVAISGGITRHGLAFNICTDLSAFDAIIACGNSENKATSLVYEMPSLNHDSIMTEASENLAQFLAKSLKFDDVNWVENAVKLAESLDINNRSLLKA